MRIYITQDSRNITLLFDLTHRLRIQCAPTAQKFSALMHTKLGPLIYRSGLLKLTPYCAISAISYSQLTLDKSRISM
ncbi:hypothetical protein [Candidatus Erwinia haradaeae]|uniref:hypothetical protein n=1 Tax=Candidatus Erwinia haradaeae TaxID=1922217 RepID=UPI0009350E9E|nr:hypothetical protein [Candidatus Erwinia haradaeae]